MNEVPAEKPARKSRLPVILGIVLLVAILLGIAWWWYNRPIQPVVLTPPEKQVVEQKIEAIHQSVTPATPEPAEEPEYQKGSREIVLTERELNGLLNHNTNLGQTVSFQLATGAVHARIETDLDPQLPIVGGRKLKARARFLIDDTAEKPSLVLDDLTVWGISLPNDWLGGLKGQNLLEKTVGGPLAGVEEFKIERGRLMIRLKE